MEEEPISLSVQVHHPVIVGHDFFRNYKCHRIVASVLESSRVFVSMPFDKTPPCWDARGDVVKGVVPKMNGTLGP